VDMRHNQASLSSIGSPFHNKPKIGLPNTDLLKVKPITGLDDFARRSKSALIGREGSPGESKPKKRLRNKLQCHTIGVNKTTFQVPK